MSAPDIYEGDEEVRRLVCDDAGHDWQPVPDGMSEGEVCIQCGAQRSVPLSREQASDA